MARIIQAPRRRRKPRRRLLTGAFVVVALAAVGVWYFYPRTEPPVSEEAGPIAQADPARPERAAEAPEPEAEDQAALVADERVMGPSASAKEAEPETVAPGMEVLLADNAPSGKVIDPTVVPAKDETQTGNAAIDNARRQFEAGKLLEARRQLSTLLAGKLTEDDDRAVRALLKRIADDTIFSKRIVPDDALVDEYAIQSGDRLINIGRKYSVPAEALMLINGIKDARTIRAGQRLKVARGPFHARIYKSKFRMDVYLGDVYLRSFPVGLGSDNGTPVGKWKVKNRLSNPTYYPPASSSTKRIIAADDPENPLGEHWIGLEGTEGDAVGREGYGIHGTIEPESVGKNVSLGCVRMRNEDVAFFYSLVMPGRSTVTIMP